MRDQIITALEAYRIQRGSGNSEPLRAVDVVGIADAIMAANPAPTEAKDEGAALSDEDHAVIKRCVERQPKLYVRGQHEGYYIHSDIASLIDMIGRAHPSPTPAADADRVRIAVELINAEINAPLTGPTHGAWDRGRIAGLKEALAALKSTAAKDDPA